MCRLSSGSTAVGSFGAVRFDHGGVPVPARAKSNDMWQLSDNGEGARPLAARAPLPAYVPHHAYFTRIPGFAPLWGSRM